MPLRPKDSARAVVCQGRARARGFATGALLALSLSACDDSTSPAELPASSGATFHIADAVHNGGAEHFYLLPPLVAPPSTGGTFDGSLRPSVEVCELVSSACGAVIAHFSRGGGTGAEVIKVDAGNARYFVNWNTQQCRTGACTLDPAKFYRVRILLSGFELGHADLDVVSRPQDIKNVSTGEFIPLVEGKLLQIRFRLEHGIELVNEAQMSAISAKYHPNSVRYSDHGTQPATGRSGSASLTARALLNRDGTTDIDVTTGQLDAARTPPGNLDHVQLKALDETGGALWTRNHTGLTGGGSWHASYPILGRGLGFQVQANVSGIDANRTDVVTVGGTVGRRPDLAVQHLSNPAQARRNVGVMISTTVRELNGDVGATADCNLYIDGVRVDQAHGIWVDAGDAVTCAFTYRFTATGTKAIAVRLEGVQPGDDDLANNSVIGTITVVNGNDFSYYAYAGQEDAENVFADDYKYEETRSDDPTYRYYFAFTRMNGTSSFRARTHYLEGSMPSEVTFPLTSARFTAVSGGTTRQAVAYENLGADYVSSHGSGSTRGHESCATRFTNDASGQSFFHLCSGASTNDGGTTWFPYTFFTQERWAGVATYYSENTFREIFASAGLDFSSAYTSDFIVEAGTQPPAPLGVDYSITVVIEDTPIGGTPLTYSASPVIALTEYPESYNRSWDNPYSCTSFTGGYYPVAYILNYCSQSKGYHRYNYGETSGGPDPRP